MDLLSIYRIMGLSLWSIDKMIDRGKQENRQGGKKKSVPVSHCPQQDLNGLRWG